MLHALRLVRQSSGGSGGGGGGSALSAEEVYELGHHLLKSNPAKYMPQEFAPDMPTCRDAQMLWIQRAAGAQIASALLYERNVFYPNNKASGNV